MLDFILFIILLFGFLIGLKRGFIMQLVHLIGFVAAYIVAYLYYDDLAPKLELWIPYPSSNNGSVSFLLNSISLEQAYYNAIAFAILFFATKIILQILGSMLDFLAHLPLLHTVNRWLGGLLGFIEIYLIVFILLYVATLVPIGNFQTYYENSWIAQGMVKNTPVFSEAVKEMWMKHMA
ncbi:CvpA family protein [Bacillus sp. NEB1478]|uniref:CvpA family protein n=1 Tax=Bacillus sp. NEB1478 TaxID=3073816 RepID=UPI002873C2F0|nr:CvpA family protein [Bacillus sp. NEB1478]WNB93209.1 CvpA family protein [Bacillus sp. NEB1478]